MNPEQLDTLYTQLAQAIHSAGSKSELYLAMLSLKHITAADPACAQRNIASTLIDLQPHEGAPT
jgi:hypothetical protein